MSTATYKVEFWARASGRDRKHRSRYYNTAEGMLRAGVRWEAKGSDYWCRYWNGLGTWVSASKSKSKPGAVLETLNRTPEPVTAPTSAPIHVEELAEINCDNPDCTDPTCSEILAIIPACHPTAGIHAEYVKAEGILHTSCKLCRKPVVAFKISHRLN